MLWRCARGNRTKGTMTALFVWTYARNQSAVSDVINWFAIIILDFWPISVHIVDWSRSATNLKLWYSRTSTLRLIKKESKRRSPLFLNVWWKDAVMKGNTRQWFSIAKPSMQIKNWMKYSTLRKDRKRRWGKRLREYFYRNISTKLKSTMMKLLLFTCAWGGQWTFLC